MVCVNSVQGGPITMWDLVQKANEMALKCHMYLGVSEYYSGHTVQLNFMKKQSN
jgi:hypothetical protein